MPTLEDPLMGLAPDPSTVAAAQPTMRAKLHVDGQAFVLAPGEITARQDKAVWDATGLTVIQAFQMLEAGQIALHALAGLIWVARTQSGEGIEIDEVLDSLTLGSVADAEYELEEEVHGEGPPA